MMAATIAAVITRKKVLAALSTLERPLKGSFEVTVDTEPDLCRDSTALRSWRALMMTATAAWPENMDWIVSGPNQDAIATMAVWKYELMQDCRTPLAMANPKKMDGLMSVTKVLV
jgi:hypothetical protein